VAAVRFEGFRGSWIGAWLRSTDEDLGRQGLKAGEHG
jgi:hypothetical protein